MKNLLEQPAYPLSRISNSGKLNSAAFSAGRKRKPAMTVPLAYKLQKNSEIKRTQLFFKR